MENQNKNKTFIIVSNEAIEASNNEHVVIDGKTVTIINDSIIYITYQLDNSNKTVNINCQASNIALLEKYQLQGEVNIQKEINVSKQSNVSRYVDNETELNNVNISEVINVYQDANVTCAYVDMSDANGNSIVHYKLLEQGANVDIRLAALCKLEEKKNIEITMEHLAPLTSANMDNYGVVKQSGTLVIDGICTIKKGMYQSQSHQVNKIIVFDSASSAKANPYLYIDEYDVKASHGASVGKIDEEHLYYLQSRGLTRNDAMHLVVYGYFTPVLEYIHDEELKNEFSTKVKEKVGM